MDCTCEHSVCLYTKNWRKQRVQLRKMISGLEKDNLRLRKENEELEKYVLILEKKTNELREKVYG